MTDETLDGLLAECLVLLAEGASDPGSVWHSPALATVAADGSPQLRTVILRSFDPETLSVETHTDIRSAKYAELLARPTAALHGWDRERRVQMRLSGRVTLHTADMQADAAWAGLRPASRATYRVQPGPGTKLDLPSKTTDGSEASGRTVFCVIRLAVHTLEYLRLGQDSHLRARFVWADGARTGMWLVP